MQNFDHDRIFNGLSVAGKLLTVWPLDDNVGRLRVICYDTVWWIYMANCVTLAPSLAVGIYNYFDDLVSVMKSIVELTYMSEMCFNLIYCKCKRAELKNLLAEHERFYKSSTVQEKIFRRTYMKRINFVYGVMTAIFFFGALVFISAPLVLPNQSVPLNTIYPINVEENWGRCVVYFLNIFAIMEATAAIIVDMIVITIIWSASFKFQLLLMKAKYVFTGRQLKERIKEHQDAIRYVTEMNKVVSYIILKSTWAISVYVVSCSLLVIRNVPLFEITQFFLITFLSTVRLFVCGWSAQIMTDTAYDNAISFYNVTLIYGSQTLRQDLTIIHQRCQRPVVLSVCGFISELSLRSCAGVFYKSFKYFTTLRAIFNL